MAIQYINRLEVLSAEGRKEQDIIQEKPVLDAFWSWEEKAIVETIQRVCLQLERSFNV